ncbi:unnamed protein product [Colias eurytheme]|nr:unnamed protein product [Colias eurytheme]
MKVLVASLVCLLIISVQSGGARKHDSRVKEKEQTGEVDWPNPDNINNFSVPDSFTNGTDADDVQNDVTDHAGKSAHGRNSKSHNKHSHH